MIHRELVKKTENIELTVKWLLEEGFLKNMSTCTECKQEMKIRNKKELYFYKCLECDKTKSIFADTIFYKTKKKIIEVLDLIYFWSLDLVQKKVAYQCNTNSRETTINWYKKLCFLSGRIIRNQNNNKKIGGYGHVVQIDESKFSKRKYNVGRIERSPWVIGGIDLITKDVFFVEVFSRDSTTLLNIILENVEEGTTIYTDKWKGYINLNQYYHHLDVNHTTNFVDPITGANTQLIESTWNSYKKLFKARSISSNCNITDYFYEFMFKKKYGNSAFIIIMQNLYEL